MIDRYIYIHIPKTGGTTLSNIAARQYLPWQIFRMNMSKGGIIKNIKRINKKRGLKLVIGHIGYGTNMDLAFDFQYISCLRNPVDVFISNFCHPKFDEKHHNNKFFKNLSLSSYIESNKCRTNVLSSYLSSHNWSEYQTPEMLSDTSETYNNPVNENHYREALHVLKYKLKIFGITDRFDESLLLFKEYLNWKFLYYTPLLKTKNKIVPSHNEIAKIRSVNKYDIMLYEAALDIFDKNFSSIEKADRKLDIFKKRNKKIGYPISMLCRIYTRLLELLL